MQLGVQVSLRRETDPAAAFAAARAAGFVRGQVTFHQHGISPERVRQTAVAAREAGFHVEAIGCYFNPLRPDDAEIAEANIADWKTVAANMGLMNGAERIVCWSGTLGKTLATPNLLNGEEQTFNNLYIALSGMLEQTRGLPLEIVLEPYTAHVLHDAKSCARFCAQFPGGEVKVVLDAPNLLSQTDYSHRAERIQTMIPEIAPATGLVHLKDIGLNDQGHRVFVRAGAGTLDYKLYLRAIVERIPEVPVILESVTNVDEMIAARTFVEGILQDLGL